MASTTGHPRTGEGRTSIWPLWILVTASVAVHSLGDGAGVEQVLRTAALSAGCLLVALRRPSWAPAAVAALLVGASMLVGRPSAVLIAGSLAMWAAVTGAARSDRWDPDRLAVLWVPLSAAAVLTMTAASLWWPLALLAATWIAAMWLTSLTATPSWALSGSAAAATVSARFRLLTDGRGGTTSTSVGTAGAGTGAATVGDDGAAARPRRADLGTPALAWLSVTAIGSWVQNVAARSSEEGLTWASVAPWISPTAGKGGWDSLFYINIARLGYELPPDQTFTSRPESDLVAYFPGYPLAIRAVSWFPGVDEPLASVLIAAAGGLAATLLFWVWMSDRGVSTSAARTALAVLLLYPYAFMLTGVAYSEPMALALVLAAFVLIERDRHLLAGVAAAAATFTRPTTLALVAALPLLVIERAGGLALGRRPATGQDDQGPSGRPGTPGGRSQLVLDRRRSLRSLGRSWGALLAGAGVGAFALWLWLEYGDPLGFWSVQDSYGQGSALRLETWAKVDFLRSVPDMGWEPETANRLAALAATLVAAATVPAIARRFGVAYAVFVAGLVASVLVGARYFAPGGRYLVLAFPVMALAGEVLERRTTLKLVVLVGCAIGWAALTWRFARTDSLGW